MTLIPKHIRDLLEPPEPALIEAGAGGEKLVAKTRLILWCFIGLAPMAAVLAVGSQAPMVLWIALCAVGVAIAMSIWLVVLLRRGTRIRFLGYITGAGDVTLITLTLAMVAVLGGHNVAINTQVSWTVYLLAILATSMRFDVRVCLFVGFITLVEYLALVIWVARTWDIPVNVYSPQDIHSTSLILQIARIMLMLAATALAVGVVYRSRQLIYSSGTDRLTGLGNRTYFDERLAVELSRAARSGAPLAMALFDLDHFKQFNDQWGHENGDRALKLLAGILSTESRKSDIVARWGGEEFVIVLPDTDLAAAVVIAERIRARLGDETLRVGNERARLQVSCGIASFPSDGERATDLFAVADRRLMAAKRAGRNRTVAEDTMI